MQMANPQLGAVNYNGNSTGGGPSFFGTGQYQSPGVTIDPNAFNNAVGQQAGQQLGTELNGYLANTTAPAATGNMAGYNQGMAGQLGLAQQYQQMAAGNGPSLAAVQAQQSGAANLAATESMLGSARGAGNPAAAQAAAAAAQSTGQQQIAQNAVMGRTQEELGALQGAAGLYGNIAGQGLQQQGLGQQLNLANQQNNLAANTAYMQQLGQINAQQQAGQIAGQQAQIGVQENQNQLGYNAYQASAAGNAALFNGLMQGASSAGGALFGGATKQLGSMITGAVTPTPPAAAAATL